MINALLSSALLLAVFSQSSAIFSDSYVPASALITHVQGWYLHKSNPSSVLLQIYIDNHYCRDFLEILAVFLVFSVRKYTIFYEG